MTTPTPSPRTAFFYGTLMAPQVLHRVCHGSTSPANPIYTASNLTTSPALLPQHRRHRVKNADYPAILPHPTSSVRGTLVAGLTDADIWRLDIFEGDEYSRERVKVKLLGEGGEGEEVEAETYIWKAPPSDLEDTEWDFAEFQREKMRFWVGSEGEGEYAGRPSIIGQLRSLVLIPEKLMLDCVEVDEAVAAADGTGGRGANGHITNALDEEIKKSAV